MSQFLDKRFWSRLLLVSAAALSLGVMATSSASAQRSRDDDEEKSDSNRVFSPDIGEIVSDAQEKMNADPPDQAGAMDDLNRALEHRGVSAFEIGVILQLRAYLKYQTEDVQGALADWNRALTDGDLNDTERLGVMYYVGQVYLSEGDYREAVDRLEVLIRLGGDVTDKVHLNLVAAYVELGDLRSALRHARAAFEIANPREKKHYDTLNYLYTELNMPAERAELLSEMVALFPQEKGVWNSIAALHAEAGRDRKAFEIRKIMYLNGMLTSETEIMQVVDYYSYYEVPYRGARILEREMNAGRVERTQKNLEKLARLYRQANEFDKAIPALEAAARMSPDGELYRTLGEAYYAEARLDEAEGALMQALNKGGLDKPGDTWIVLGNARYENNDREGAIEAFEQGERFASSRETATEWAEFVEQEIAAARNRAQFGVDVKKEEVRVQCERAVADLVLYRTNHKPEDTDCEAVIRGDFSSVPEVIEMQAAVDAEFGGGATQETSLQQPAAAAADGDAADESAGR